MILALLLCTIAISSIFIGTTVINHQSWQEIIDDFYGSKVDLMDYFIDQTVEDMNSIIYSNAVWTDLQEKIDEKDYEWLYDNATGYIIDNENLEIDVILVTSEDITFIDKHGEDVHSALMSTAAFNQALQMDTMSSEIIWINQMPMIIVAAPVLDNNFNKPSGTYIVGRWLDKSQLNDLSSILGKDITSVISVNNKKYYDSVSTEKYSIIRFSHEIELDHSVDYFNVEFNSPVYRKAFVVTKNHIMAIIMSIGVICVFLTLLYYRKMSRAIINVIDAVSRISEGEYDARAGGTNMAEFNHLVEAVNKMAVEITYRIKEIDKNYLSMIEIMASAVELNDAYTSEHNLRVAHFARMIGEYINFEHIETLDVAARLHDIGKISVPTEILNKPGVLTEKEFEVIKEHPVAGYQIMDNIDFFKDVKYGVLYHHERYDGKGYPEGLKGDDIPIIAQIISVADVFDALVTDRPYRKAFSVNKALEIMVENSGTMFNPMLVSAFINQYKVEMKIVGESVAGS
jgi:HD-GYP domain-containing protein (c-di-GMP phosphodiesterase class II)